MRACALALLCSALPAFGAAGVPLVHDGRSDYVIVLPDAPQPVETTAARELQQHLAQATGAQLPIVAEGQAPRTGRQIVVGDCRRFPQLVPGVNLNALGYDGIVIRHVGDTLVLAGRPPRGSLYAVYTFLEDVVGCRWWTSTESDVPRRTTLELPPLNIRYAPPLRYREAFYRDAFDGVFAARMKCNGHHDRIPPEYGGHQRFAGFVHTFYPLLPPEKYFAAHPEWYSEIRGQRTADRAQLCLTNEAMRQELVRNALAWLRREKQVSLISISQNDWHRRCECARCRAVEEEEGSPSGLLLRFVNAVAADIEQEFPDVLVETLAYQYTRQPPRWTRPRRNVVIRLCSIECCFQQPLAQGTHNEKFRDDIKGWSRVAPQLFVWDYVTNFSNYLLPHPNWDALAPNVRFFVDHHTIGLFEQGDAGSTVGDFVRLRAWLLSHLMWNPRLDEKRLVAEFLAGYYGAAAPHLQAYLDLVTQAAHTSDVYLRCFMPNTSAWLTLADMNRATRLFQQAAAAVASDPVLSARVRRERLPLDHAWLMHYHALRRSSQRTNTEWLGPTDPMAACEEFIRLAHQWKVGQWRESIPFADYEDGLRRRFRPAGPPPEACQNLRPDQWIDAQDHEFNLARAGHWATIVDDPRASDGKAARMPGDHFEWAVSYPLSEDLAADGPWHCYVVLRSEAQATSGPAVSLGIYDARAKRSVAHRRLTVEQTAHGYQAIDLGVHALHGEMYLWVAPPKRPGEVTAVYVDRMFLVRVPQSKQKQSVSSQK
jgi:hypothetical protein